jgi:BirA family biotin operon repressor/biotin-[acetyl-CoA-carboxylase] ligase
VILRPALGPDEAGVVTLGAGASGAEGIRASSRADVRCKWPNDLVTSEGKVGGILAEGKVASDALEHVVVGIGVNTSVPPGVPGAAALTWVDPELFVAAFLSRLRELLEPGNGGAPAAVMRAYRPLCATLGRTVRARIARSELVEGIAVDLDEAGGLVVETGSGIRVVALGEVEHLS